MTKGWQVSLQLRQTLLIPRYPWGNQSTCMRWFALLRFTLLTHIHYNDATSWESRFASKFVGQVQSSFAYCVIIMTSITSLDDMSLTSRSKVSTLSRRPLTMACLCLAIPCPCKYFASAEDHLMWIQLHYKAHSDVCNQLWSEARYPEVYRVQKYWYYCLYVDPTHLRAILVRRHDWGKEASPASASAPFTTWTFSASAFSIAATLHSRDMDQILYALSRHPRALGKFHSRLMRQI